MTEQVKYWIRKKKSEMNETNEQAGIRALSLFLREEPLV